MKKACSTVFCFASLIFAMLCSGPLRAAEEPFNGPPEFKGIKYRLAGPYAGGRISRVAGVPADPLTYYAATASGGVWKSSDGGKAWKPIFDSQPISSIGSIAVAPSDPNVIYVGSGEANIRGNVAAGNGIYKSTDAGKSWTHAWNQEGQIGTMVVHPTNPEIALAAVLGHAFGPNEQRGVYRTRDGGKTWQRILYRDPDTGASDVCFDPSNPNILFAGLWQARRRPWQLISGGPGSGLYVSRDGGETWKQLAGNGLPEGIWGKIGVAVAPSNGLRVYALIEAEKGGLFRSDDGGDNWTLVNDGRGLRQRAWYYSTITVDPKNPDIVWCPQVALLKSIDAGKTFKNVKGLHHGDHHDVWIDPVNPRRMINGNDGGVDISVNAGESWFAPPLPVSQFYHVAADNRNPYFVSGAMQDLGTVAGPSNSLNSRGIRLADWHGVGGGEAGFTAPDPSDPHVVYAGEYGGVMTRFDLRTRQVRNVAVFPVNPSGHGAEDLKYRFQWTAPILVSPHDPKTVYHGSNVLFKTTDGGMTWIAISPDLTRNDKSKQKWSGGPITGDNTGVEVYCTIFAVAESPRQKDLIWVGTDDGLVQLSRDGGKTWTNVTANIPGMPEWGTVSIIEPSPFDAATAYVAVDAHRLDDMRPYVFKTADYGRSWKSLSSGLPSDVYLHAVREDPKKRGLLYLGTERGVSYSTDDGASWKALNLNLPAVAVHDLLVKNNDLVIGTHGRSVWILDDLTPIREASSQILSSDMHLFPARPAYRWRYHDEFRDPAAAENPPRGAILYYYLKNKPKGELTIEIVDSAGKFVNTLSSKKEPEEEEIFGEYDEDRAEKKPLPTEAGVQRANWDLTHAGASKIKGVKVDSGDPSIGPLATAGIYTARLKVDGKTATTPITVLADQRVQALPAELDEQLKFSLQVRDALNRLARVVQQIRSMKTQLSSETELWKQNPKMESLVKPAQAIIAKGDALEEKLHNPRAKISYDILAQPGGAKLYSQLTFLFDAVKSSDGPPTQGMRQVFEQESAELGRYEQELQSGVMNDLAALNEMARKLEVPHIVVQ
ncbi:MAG TPA: glycosyl hydrolase [Acidobacteriota bacterium]|jgi:photosystem II stability/assembly factor-like uncharacterized protein